LIRAIFTLGIACAFDSPTKRKLDNVKADLLEEKTIFEALLKRMGYFDGLVGVAKEMTQQAAGLLESTKQFRAKIRDTKEELETDYEPGMVLENMGDVDFANDYAESLFESLDSLMQECDRVSADCIQRKHKMDLALVGLTGDDLEVVQLASAPGKAIAGEKCDQDGDDMGCAEGLQCGINGAKEVCYAIADCVAPVVCGAIKLGTTIAATVAIAIYM